MFKLPKFRTSLLLLTSIPQKPNTFQSGFASIFVVLLLILGVVGGTYLVQQQTNLMPFAAENKTSSKTINTVQTQPGDFPSPKSKYMPYRAKQELLDSYLSGKIEGSVYCEKNVLMVKPKNPKGNEPKTVYIIDCNPEAVGSIKGKLTCGKTKGGDYGCIDKTGTAKSGAGGPNLSNQEKDEDEDDPDSPAFANPKSNKDNAQKGGDSKSDSDTKKTESDTKPAGSTAVKASDAPGITEKQIKDCGFTITESGVPVFAVQVGGKKSSATEEKTCDDIRAAQLKYFEGAIEKARQEAAEAKKNGDTAKAEELEKKATEAEKKTAECEGKKDQAFVECAKAAVAPVESLATAAQSQAISNAYKKMQLLLSQGEGSESKCVKADMGVTPFLEAPRIRQKRADNNDEARRLLLCTGADKKFKWRVLIGGNAGSDFSDDGEDKGNDAERILGLHGTETAAKSPKTDGPYEPEFVVAGKNGFSIYGQDKASVEKTLTKYLAAAKDGTTTMRGPAVPGDNGSQDGTQKDSTAKDESSTPSTNATFSKLNPSIAKEDAKRALTFSQATGKKYTCAESSDPVLKNVIVKIENDGSLAKKVEVVCNNGTDRKYICAAKSGDKELGCYNQSDLK